MIDVNVELVWGSGPMVIKPYIRSYIIVVYLSLLVSGFLNYFGFQDINLIYFPDFPKFKLQ